MPGGDLPPPVSVVIPSYNDGALVGETVAPLLTDPAAGEVIVVVDGSEDGSYGLLEALAQGERRLRPFLIENRGRAGARQFGIEQARHDVVLLLDADVIAGPALVTGHARWHAAGPPRLVLGYMPIAMPRRRPESFVVEKYSRMYEERCAEYERNPAAILQALWGGNLSLPRRVIAEAGGFDGGLGVRYNDDFELGLRLAETGVEPVFDRHLFAEHRFQRSVDGLISTAREYGADMVRIEARYPGRMTLPPPPRSRLDAALRRLVVRPRPHAVLLRGARTAARWAGRLRAWELERRLGHFLERLQIEMGMREAARHHHRDIAAAAGR